MHRLCTYICVCAGARELGRSPGEDGGGVGWGWGWGWGWSWCSPLGLPEARQGSPRRRPAGRWGGVGVGLGLGLELVQPPGIAWGTPRSPRRRPAGRSSGFLEAKCGGARGLRGGNPGLQRESVPWPPSPRRGWGCGSPRVGTWGGG